MKKYIVGLVVILCLVASAIIFAKMSNNNQTPNNPAPIKIGYRTQDMYAPLFVGIEKGVFTKYGLTVEPVKFDSTNAITDALLAGRIDASLGGVNTFLLFTIEEKSPNMFKIFSVSTEDEAHSSTAIVVANSSTLKISDLNNKKLGAYLGSSIKVFYDRFVKENNLKNTTLIQMDPKLELQSLQAGQIDAAFLLEPLVAAGTYKKVSQPLETAIFSKYFINDIPFAASIVSTKYLNEHPEETKMLVSATDEIIDMINSNPDQTKEILPKYTGADIAVTNLVSIAPYKKYSNIDTAKLNELSSLLLEIGELKSPVSADIMILPKQYVESD